MKKPLILIILGTARIGRQSEHAAKYLLSTLKKKFAKAQFKLVDVKDFVGNRTIPSWADPYHKTDTWRKLAKKADGFIVVTPEYNRGYPGELKILLDMAYTDEYGEKPAVISTVSGASHGGTNVEQHILPVLRIIGMEVLRSKIAFPNVKELFEKDKKEIDKAMKERVEKVGKALLAKI